MANLNLSEFGEKLFVADADHTFIWDTVGAISKRVSRNSWLNSGTLTSDAPVTISQTWNAGSNVMTALKVVATDTASGPTSNLLELWAGSTPALNFRVSKGGVAQFGSGSNRAVLFDANGGIGVNRADASLSAALIYLGNNGPAARITIVSGGTIGWSSSSLDVSGGNATPVTALNSDAANTLALRNGTNAQTFNVYGTYTSGTSYERLTLSAPSAANAIIGTNKGSGGGTARGLDLHTDGAARMTITTAGNVGIGTTAPTSKLQVTGGDVEIETVTSGIIMKAAGTSTRYRITLNAGGTALVFTAI